MVETLWEFKKRHGSNGAAPEATFIQRNAIEAAMKIRPLN
jgi:hypothetical protein